MERICSRGKCLTVVNDGVGGYAPLAVAAGSGAGASLVWVHGNHLGVPIAFTDGTGASISPPSYTLPGFPGQLKTLSDIYYNRYRDYDSSLGRYIQADPVGLGGGSNPFVYAHDNPLEFTDPRGLATTIPVERLPGLVVPECPLCGVLLAIAPYEYRGGQTIGNAIGDVIKKNCDNDHCQKLYGEIKQARDVLAKRLQDFREDQFNLPPGPGPMTRSGHVQAFKSWQKRLKGLLVAADTEGCRDYVPDAWTYATMTLDRRF